MKNIDKIHELLVDAMNGEIEARNFYSRAAQKAESKSGQSFFTELSDFEQKHYEKIREIIENLQKEANLGSYDMPVIDRTVNPELSGELEPNKDEIEEILSLAIRSEQKARDRYLNIAAMMDDQHGKTIFNNLADDERRHHDLLEAQYYQISNKGTIIWGD